MNIVTQFEIGDSVTHRERTGKVVQINITVPQAATDPEDPNPPITAGTPFIVYKVYFDGVFESRPEGELS